MKGLKFVAKYLVVCLSLMMLGCGTKEPEIDVKALLAQPKTYVSSEKCKLCHLEHYDSWKATLHSRMLVDAQKNEDAIIAPINEKKIRADLAKIEKLKVPADKIYVPKVEEIKYTIGSQWKQRYLVEKAGELYISPIQFNAETGRWVNYHEADWDKNPWIKGCGGCHATGVDIDKKSFVEPGVSCESCHGPGSLHVALPKTAVFAKRQTIMNPSKLTPGVAVQICGSCHNRGNSTQIEGVEWPVGYRPGKALTAYYLSVSYAAGDKGNVYANEMSKGHHQQYIDWVQSKHYLEGVNCVSCHYVHQLGVPSTRSQTKASGSQQCLSCHALINNNLAHSIHSFGNCVGCHMPRIARSAESGDLHSHVFVCLLPKETLKNKEIPNSCQTCHRHKNENLADLQKRFDALSVLPKPQGVAMPALSPTGM